MSDKQQRIKAIDQLLPQTQCGLCEYPGCKPYATAIVEGEANIDRCLPGGVDTLYKLGQLTGVDPEPMVTEMQDKQKPAATVVIREAECIGCTKCIQACPVDAIIGSAKTMHTVITDACTGCELCIPPCPVDCIDLITLPEPTNSAKQAMAEQSRQRYEARNARLQRLTAEKKAKHQQAKLGSDDKLTVSARQQAIQEVLARVNAKKGNQE